MKRTIALLLALSLLLSACGKKDPAPTDAPDTLPGTTGIGQTDEAHIHKYDKTVISPTCTEEGYTLYVCSCGDTWQDAQVAALGHSFEQVLTAAATCTESGQTVNTCTVCGYTEEGAEIAPLGHNYTSTTVAPTQVQRGYTQYNCTRCDEYYKSNFVLPLTGAYTPNFSTGSGIPQYMQDSYILRAWEYIGVDVEKMRANGTLFVKYGQTINAGVIYPFNTGGGSGLEKVADSSTVTGYAPNIAKFHRSEAAGGGLVCAGFVTYYILNYLRWIEGIDCTQLRQTVEWYVDVKGVNTRGVLLWEQALSQLADRTANSSVKRIYKEAYDVDLEIPKVIYNQMLPGDIITFGHIDDNGNTIYGHIAVYAGEWNGKHFIIHSANTDGPWMGTPEGVGISGTITSHPVGVYRLLDVPLLHADEGKENEGTPPVTEPPVTEPPVTEPPATEPPATEPAVTEPPVAETEPEDTMPEVPLP